MAAESRPQPIHRRFAVPDRSYLGMVRRDVSRLAEQWGLSEGTVGKLNIIVSELTSNLVKHTPHGGELLVRALGHETDADGVEIICLDQGPGMRDPTRMMEDGTSTYGSAGEGLGAIRRQADEFDLFSQPGVGTALLTRLYRRQRPAPEAGIRYGAVVVAKPGETACGDGWAMRHTPAGLLILVTDGLGHGPEAERATLRALQAFVESEETEPASLLRDLHPVLKSTRGAVGAVVLYTAAGTLQYCGVGNITGRLLGTGTTKSLMSYNGIIGHSLPNTLHTNAHDTAQHPLLLLASDGLKTRWEIQKYPGLLLRDPALIAAVLYRDHVRGTDDTLVLVVPRP